MTRDTVKFVPNPNFGKELKQEIDAKAQRVIDQVTAQRDGKDLAAIQEELDGELSRIGLELPAQTLQEWATVIADGGELKADITLV